MSDYKARLTAYYKKYNPDKVKDVDTTLVKFKGKEEDMFKTLVAKYGPEPGGASPKAASPKPAAKSAAGGAAGGGDYKARLTAYYKKYNPEKVSTVDATLVKFKGKEEDMFKTLVAKYGPEPASTPSSPSRAASPAGGGSDYKARLTAYYKKYNPEKVSTVDATLVKFKGKEEDMFKTLVGKYGPEPSSPAAGSSGGSDYKARLTAYYKKYNPEKVNTVDATLVKFKGKEEDMFKTLVSKYGPEPTAEKAAAPAAPSGGSASAEGDYETRLTRFLQKYAPDKVGQVGTLLSKQKGKEEAFIAQLVSKYGPEPPASEGGAGGSSDAAAPKETYESRLTRFLQKYAPDKVGQVGTLLSKQKGKEEAFIAQLVSKYGPEPPAPEGGAGGGDVPPPEEEILPDLTSWDMKQMLHSFLSETKQSPADFLYKIFNSNEDQVASFVTDDYAPDEGNEARIERFVSKHCPERLGDARSNIEAVKARHLPPQLPRKEGGEDGEQQEQPPISEETLLELESDLFFTLRDYVTDLGVEEPSTAQSAIRGPAPVVHLSTLDKRWEQLEDEVFEYDPGTPTKRTKDENLEKKRTQQLLATKAPCPKPDAPISLVEVKGLLGKAAAVDPGELKAEDKQTYPQAAEQWVRVFFRRPYSLSAASSRAGTPRDIYQGKALSIRQSKFEAEEKKRKEEAEKKKREAEEAKKKAEAEKAEKEGKDKDKDGKDGDKDKDKKKEGGGDDKDKEAEKKKEDKTKDGAASEPPLTARSETGFITEQSMAFDTRRMEEQHKGPIIAIINDLQGNPSGELCVACSSTVQRSFDALWTPVGIKFRQFLQWGQTKEGTIEKLSSGSRKKWQPRFFRASDKGLLYYENEDPGQRPKGQKHFTVNSKLYALDTPEIRKKLDLGIEEKLFENTAFHYFAMKVALSDQTHTLFCMRVGSKQERDEWMGFLESCLERLRLKLAGEDTNPGRWCGRFKGLRKATTSLAEKATDELQTEASEKQRRDEIHRELRLLDESADFMKEQRGALVEKKEKIRRMINEAEERLDATRVSSTERERVARLELERLDTRRGDFMDKFETTRDNTERVKAEVEELLLTIVEREHEKGKVESDLAAMRVKRRSAEERAPDASLARFRKGDGLGYRPSAR